MFYSVGNISSTTGFKYFVLMELFLSNSNFNNLFESSSIKDFLVNSSVDSLFDSLMCLNISFWALKILKFSLSGLILINL